MSDKSFTFTRYTALGIHCAKSRKAFFRLLYQWEQSLLLRKTDLEALAAYREGQIR
jgi:hypothetical protein